MITSRLLAAPLTASHNWRSAFGSHNAGPETIICHVANSVMEKGIFLQWSTCRADLQVAGEETALESYNEWQLHAIACPTIHYSLIALFANQPLHHLLYTAGHGPQGLHCSKVCTAMHMLNVCCILPCHTTPFTCCSPAARCACQRLHPPRSRTRPRGTAARP